MEGGGRDDKREETWKQGGRGAEEAGGKGKRGREKRGKEKARRTGKPHRAPDLSWHAFWHRKSKRIRP